MFTLFLLRWGLKGTGDVKGKESMKGKIPPPHSDIKKWMAPTLKHVFKTPAVERPSFFPKKYR